MERPYRLWAESTPMSIGIFKFYVEFIPENDLNSYFRNSHLLWKPSYQKPENTLFSNKIIILTDRYTVSAAEDFVVPFKDNARALIIGEASEGSTGQPYIYNFGNGIRIGIGTKRAYMPDGSRFEGIGIPPDIEIKLKREDLYKDKDKILERALEEADKLSIQ
jgi:carboxyl-terminal processing protease